MEWHEKEFGWLWKNVGGHFPCLFHDLYVNAFSKFQVKEVDDFGHRLIWKKKLNLTFIAYV